MTTRSSPPVRAVPSAQDELFAPASAVAKYRALIIGRPGLWALIKYEVVAVCTQWVPGALGLSLRRIGYRTLLGRMGRNVVFGQNVVLRHPHKIRVGDNVVIDDNCLLDAKGTSNEGITIGSGVFIGRNTICSTKNGDITIGDEANIGFNCEIFSASRVSIGRKTLLAAYTYLVGGDHQAADRSIGVLDQDRTSRGIEVGAGVWIGAGAVVLDGVRVGDRAVIGANAVVRQDVPEEGRAVGVPARLIDGTSPPGA